MDSENVLEKIMKMGGYKAPDVSVTSRPVGLFNISPKDHKFLFGMYLFNHEDMINEIEKLVADVTVLDDTLLMFQPRFVMELASVYCGVLVSGKRDKYIDTVSSIIQNFIRTSMNIPSYKEYNELFVNDNDKVRRIMSKILFLTYQQLDKYIRIAMKKISEDEKSE